MVTATQVGTTAMSVLIRRLPSKTTPVRALCTPSASNVTRSFSQRALTRTVARPLSNRRRQLDSSAQRKITTPSQKDDASKTAATQSSEAGLNTQLSTVLAESDSTDLVTAVNIPSDPNGTLPPDHPSISILGNSSLVIQRQLEMMNVLMGFEQANRYIIMDGNGQTVGYIAERDHGIGSTMVRQLARTHRSFTTHIFDRNEREVLRIHRPFAYINSRIRIYDALTRNVDDEGDTAGGLVASPGTSVLDPNNAAMISPLTINEMQIIGEAQQQWAPLRRKYNLFTYSTALQSPSASAQEEAVSEKHISEQAIEAGMAQFAHVNEPFLSWDFGLRDVSGDIIGSVNRNFGGFAREIFTDTGVYALRMDSASQAASADGQQVVESSENTPNLTLEQRAVMLATAVSIDFDYFSRHSHSGAGFMPIWFPWGGGAAAGEAGAVGAAETAGAAGAVGAAGRGVAGATGIGEGAVAGAGTMAGYEAMQRGVYGSGQGEATPEQPQYPPSSDMGDTFDSRYDPSPSDTNSFPDRSADSSRNDYDDYDDSFGPPPPSSEGPPPSSGSGEGGGDGGHWTDALSDFFGDS